MRLRHLHLPGLVHYATAANLQEHLVKRFLASKSPSTAQTPPPTIITAQFHPVYTCGRREIGTLTPEQIAHLRCDGKAEFVEALRGGQTTFHGPGQLVAYPIVDLKSHKLRPRDYVCVLEKSLISTCKRFGVKTMTTENTGVWVSEESKIASIGVHMRRNVTSHGVGLNVGREPLPWFERIVACGLEGKTTTSLEVEGVSVGVEEVGGVFVEELGSRLKGVEGIDSEEYREEEG